MRNPSPPWNYQLHRSHVSLDRHQIASRSVGQAEVESGQDLMTAEGKVEMLLTPGIFLRLDKNSTVKMISPDLTHTEVALERGRAEVEGAQQYPQNRILINLRGGQAEILTNGLYEFDADNNTVRTFDGKAVIYPDNNFQNDVKLTTHIFASRVWLSPLIRSHELSTEHIGEESDRCRNLLSLSTDSPYSPQRCVLQYGPHCSRTRYLCLHSPTHHAAIALVRAMQKPSCNNTHLRIGRLVAATRPVSQALSTVFAVKHDRNPQPVGHVFRKRNRECAVPAPITDLKPSMQSKASTMRAFCSIGRKPIPWLH